MTRLTIEQQMELSLHLESNLYPSIDPILDYVKRQFRVLYKASGLTALLQRMGLSYKKPKGVPGKASRKKKGEFVDLYNEISLGHFARRIWTSSPEVMTRLISNPSASFGTSTTEKPRGEKSIFGLGQRCLQQVLQS